MNAVSSNTRDGDGFAIGGGSSDIGGGSGDITQGHMEGMGVSKDGITKLARNGGGSGC